MDFGFAPGEGTGGLVVALDERIDVFPELSDASEACSLQGLAGEDREPALDLIEPGGVGRREMEVNVFVPGEPPVALGFVGLEVVEDDMNLAPAMARHDAVHEIEELDAAPALVVARCNLAIGDVEGGEQGRGAVPHVVVRPAADGAPVRQSQIALNAFERLDMWLLIDGDDQRALGRVEVEPNDLGRLGGKFGIVADAPRFAPGQIDLLRPQKAPDILLVHITERRGDQRRGPAAMTGWRRAVENARMRRPVSAVYLGTAPRSPVSSSPASRSAA